MVSKERYNEMIKWFAKEYAKVPIKTMREQVSFKEVENLSDDDANELFCDRCLFIPL